MIRAAVCPEYGPPEVVRIEARSSQALVHGQVRVRASAAAVNYPDVLLVANQYQISVPPPFVVGSEFAGVVVEVGDGAGDLVIGDRVTGTQMFGAFADEVVAAAQGWPESPTVSSTVPRQPSAWLIARRTTRCARSRACTLATPWSSSARAAASALPP